MRGPSAQSGYALLAALFVTAMAAVFAAACVAAVGSSLGIVRHDQAAVVASRAAAETLGRACAGLRRRPDRLTWTAAGGSPQTGVAWRLACSAVAQTEVTSAVCADVVAVTDNGVARGTVHATVELRPQPQAEGLEVTHDVRVRAPLTVAGGGLYSGGSVSGREWVSFVDGEGGLAAPRDLVHGDLWPLAAVHALGGIWAGGVEEHDGTPRSAEWADDTDFHTAPGPVEALTWPVDPAVRALFDETADVFVTPDAAGFVDLGGLPAAPASGAGSLVAVVRDGSPAPLTVAGERAAGACPLVLVLEGDAQIGAGTALTSLTGAVVACGALTVGGPASVVGHVAAATLTVDAPLEVVTPEGWLGEPLPGLVDPKITALAR